MGQQRPRSVSVAIWLLAAVVALSGFTALLSVVFEDDLIEAWAADQAASGSVEPPSIVPVAIVLFVVIALLATVLLMFFREGLNWARRSLIAMVLLMAVATLAALRVNPPVLFWLLSALAVVLDLALVAALSHKDTRAFCADSSLEAGTRS